MNHENNEDIDSIVDNFDFKPITDGLGFHHSIKDKKQVRVDLNKQSKMLSQELETRIESMNNLKVEEAKPNMGDLAPFYENNDIKAKTSIVEVSEIIEPSEQEQVYSYPSMTKRFFAWAIDFLILVTVFSLSVASVLFFADLPMELIGSLMLFDEIPASAMTIFSLFYLFYFSFMDKTLYSTFGKRVLGIQVTGFDYSQVSLMKSFARSMISLVSISFLGLPLILGLQDKFTDTVVINRYE